MTKPEVTDDLPVQGQSEKKTGKDVYEGGCFSNGGTTVVMSSIEVDVAVTVIGAVEIMNKYTHSRSVDTSVGCYITDFLRSRG